MRGYEYEPLLNFRPSFNVWKHNFEAFPFNIMVNNCIKKCYSNSANFSTTKNVSISRLSYTSNNFTLPFIKISPRELEHTTLPTIIYYHGGGFICPLDTMMLNNASFYSEKLNIHILLPEYRLAPNNSSTIILSDCNNFLSYVVRNHRDLNVDLHNLIILGDSAGGFLATTTLIWAIKNNTTPIKGLFLIYPVTDNEIDKYKSMNMKYAEWNKSATYHMWRLLRKKNCLSDNEILDSYIPVKQQDYSLFPQTYIEVQEYDTLKDEGITLAKLIKSDNVPVILKEIKGTYHGFDNMPENPFVNKILTDRCKIIEAMLNS